MAQMALSGKDYVSGTFTAPDADTTYKIEFGKTFNHYLYFIEMTDESKADFVASSDTHVRTYAWMGVYPKPVLNNAEYGYGSYTFRYKPSTQEKSGSVTSAYTVASSYITNNVRALNADATNYFIRGYSYKYTVVSLD